MRMLEILKQQKFKDIESNKIEPRTWKCLYIDERKDKKRQSSDQYHDKDGRYLPFLPHSQKELNRLINLGKRIKNLNQIICILTLPH